MLSFKSCNWQFSSSLWSCVFGSLGCPVSTTPSQKNRPKQAKWASLGYLVTRFNVTTGIVIRKSLESTFTEVDFHWSRTERQPRWQQNQPPNQRQVEIVCSAGLQVPLAGFNVSMDHLVHLRASYQRHLYHRMYNIFVLYYSVIVITIRDIYYKAYTHNIYHMFGL
jgi:hypothetical protein